jgi:hypothetical protein
MLSMYLPAFAPRLPLGRLFPAPQDHSALPPARSGRERALSPGDLIRLLRVLDDLWREEPDGGPLTPG